MSTLHTLLMGYGTLCFFSGKGAEYCDKRVCLSVCVPVYMSVRQHISRSTGAHFVHVDYGRGLVLLWRCCDVTNFRFHR